MDHVLSENASGVLESPAGIYGSSWSVHYDPNISVLKWVNPISSSFLFSGFKRSSPEHSHNYSVYALCINNMTILSNSPNQMKPN